MEASDGMLSAHDTFDIAVVNLNDATMVANALVDQNTSEDTAFEYIVPSNSFTDFDAGTTLTYSAMLSSDSALPSWLSFNAEIRTFSGTPTNSDVGTNLL